MKKAIRVLSLTLAFLIVIGMMPFVPFAFVREAEAAGTITTEDVTKKINEIWKQIGNDKTQYYWAKGYNKSEMKKIADKGNYSSAVTTTGSRAQSNNFGGVECWGFATWIEYCVFYKDIQYPLLYNASSCEEGTSQSGFIVHNSRASTSTYVVKPGDLLRIYNRKLSDKTSSSSATHSVVVWKVDGQNVTCIQCNQDNKCGISMRVMTMDEIRQRVVGVKKAFIVECPAISHVHSINSETGTCTGCNQHLQHVWSETGICAGCNIDYYSQANISSAANGVATPKTGDSFKVYSKPYTASGTVQEQAHFIGLIPYTRDLSLSKATVVSEITNHLGNTWYQLKVDQVSFPVYVYKDTVNVEWKSKVTISGVTAPKDQAVEGSEAKTIVKGTVTAQHAKISEVTAAVYDVQDIMLDLASLQFNKVSAAQAYTLAKSKAKYYAHTSSVNNSSFNLNQYDSKLQFRNLPGGHEYLYVVTATDTNGVNACSPHMFYLRTSSAAKTTYSVTLNTNGSITMQTVNQGSSIALPARQREGYEFLGWTESSEATAAKYAPNTNFTPARNIILYSVFRAIDPPSAPVLTAMSYDIAEGATQMISWNAADGATKYTARVYDADGVKVYEQSSAGTTAVVPFASAGIYTVRIEAFNGSLAGGSGESENGVRVTVHGPSTVTFLNHDGSVYSTQQVPYGGTADTPTSPSRAGYTFSRWEGSMTQVFADTTLTAVYTPIQYKVTFCDENGNAIDTQYVTYDGDVPGSAVEPQAPAKANYTFVGWNTGAWQNVTESGVKIYPVYVWANEDVPLSINITNVTAAGDGYWVYYTVTNHLSKTQLGRVVIVGKTSLGKFITQTESGAFYLGSGDGTRYQGNAYVPVDSSDMQTLATVEAYVVDSYVTKNPIAEPDTYIIGSVDGEYSRWMTADELAAFTAPYTATEQATQYSFRTKSTYATTATSYLDWQVESSTTQEGAWGNWSDWQDAAVTANDRRQVETKEVQVTSAVTKYRYGRYKSTNCSKGTWYHFNDKSAKNSYGGDWYPNYTSWSTTRHSVTSSNCGYTTTNNTLGNGKYNSSTKRYYWDKITISGVNYWWEETQTTPATYKTQYRYRDKAPDVTTYTYYKWSDWSEFSFTPVTATENKQVQTRTVYRVKLSNASHGTTYTFSGQVGPSATGKQAILNVYKVDEASDYSNQYIEQVTLGANGAYSFSFDTLETPSVHTGDYTVSLTIEGGTESLYIGTIYAPKPQYTVQFVDEVTGQSLGEQTVAEGSAATAPAVPEHEGYYFLGWEYGLGNIREDMIIMARYVKRGYTVVFVDDVQMSVSMTNDIPYETAVMAPEVTAPEGYTFIGWEAPEGMSLDSVTGHMIVTAKYEKITNRVSFVDIDGAEVASQTVGYGEYAADPFGYEEEFFDDGEEENGNAGEENVNGGIYISEEDLSIPESMYFVGWSEGAQDPVTQTLTLTPIVSYWEDVDEVRSTLEGGIYVGEQAATLEMDAPYAGLVVQYRVNTVGGVEGEWIEYDMNNAPDIAITETCVLEIEADAEDKNIYSASYEYVIVSDSDMPAAPASATAAQNDVESVIVNWAAVNGANGYMVKRTSDCGETAEFDVGTATNFIDYGVDVLRTYTYQVFAYSMIVRSGSSLMLEGNGSEEAEAFFYGDNILISAVTVTAPETVYESSVAQLSASVAPVDAYDSSVAWFCTDGTGEGYVTSDGLFYGITPGTVTVTAKALDGSNVQQSVTIQVVEVPTGAGSATLTVSSGNVRAGGTANVSVSISEDSLLQAMQFAVVYDSTKLTLLSAEEGTVMQGEAPSIGTTEEGIVYFTWDNITSLTEGGALLELTFQVKNNAVGTALIDIPTDGTKPFVFGLADSSLAQVTPMNGTLNIQQILLGDVNESGTVNIVDASLIRRYTVKLVTLTDTQLLAGDVNGDGFVNVLDAHMIRRYIAHLLEAFPAA